MGWIRDWLFTKQEFARLKREQLCLKESLESATTRVKELTRHLAILSQTTGVYREELRRAHASLRRKNKALKMLNKQRHPKANHENE